MDNVHFKFPTNLIKTKHSQVRACYKLKLRVAIQIYKFDVLVVKFVLQKSCQFSIISFATSKIASSHPTKTQACISSTPTPLVHWIQKQLVHRGTFLSFCCSQCIPIKFLNGSSSPQRVSQVPNVFLKMFAMAPHFYPIKAFAQRLRTLIYYSTLAPSTQIALFLEMLKISIFSFRKGKKSCKGK